MQPLIRLAYLRSRCMHPAELTCMTTGAPPPYPASTRFIALFQRVDLWPSYPIIQYSQRLDSSDCTIAEDSFSTMRLLT